jgi:4-alpha-glucanotransferase
LDRSRRVALLRFLLEELGRSAARVVLVTLEDLWLEPLPQNVPGTSSEEKNFRRRLAHRVPELFDRSDVIAALDAVDRARSLAQTPRDQPKRKETP